MPGGIEDAYTGIGLTPGQGAPVDTNAVRIYMGEEEALDPDLKTRARRARLAPGTSLRKPITLNGDQWMTKWLQMTPEERKAYSDKLIKAGMLDANYTAIDARSAWIALGGLAADEMRYNPESKRTPDDLLDMFIQESNIPGIEDDELGPVEERGKRAEYRQKLTAWANDNNLRISNETMKNHVTALINEEVTEQELAKVYRKQLIQAYPAFKEQLEAGMSLRDIASPYIDEIATTLEVPKDMVDFSDPALQRGLQAVSEDGKPTYVPLWQFRQQLKQDERYQYTDAAWQEMGALADQLDAMFGFRA